MFLEPALVSQNSRRKKSLKIQNYVFTNENVPIIDVRVFTHMVSCHHEEAWKYKFKNKTANKSLSDMERVAQWFTAEYLINPIAIKTDCGVATHKGPNICTHYRS